MVGASAGGGAAAAAMAASFSEAIGEGFKVVEVKMCEAITSIRLLGLWGFIVVLSLIAFWHSHHQIFLCH